MAECSTELVEYVAAAATGKWVGRGATSAALEEFAENGGHGIAARSSVQTR